MQQRRPPSSPRGKFYRPELYTRWQRTTHSPFFRGAAILFGAVAVAALIALVVLAVNRF